MTTPKVGFQTDLKLTKIDDQLWQVEEDCYYYSLLTQEYYKIHKGYNTDLASVPYVLQWLLPPDGEYAWEAALHDSLYDKVKEGSMERWVADAIFKEALSVGKVPEWQEVALYLAVRAFGGIVVKYYN